MEGEKKQVKEIGKYREWESVTLYRVVREGITDESTHGGKEEQEVKEYRAI